MRHVCSISDTHATGGRTAHATHGVVATAVAARPTEKEKQAGKSNEWEQEVAEQGGDAALLFAFSHRNVDAVACKCVHQVCVIWQDDLQSVVNSWMPAPGPACPHSHSSICSVIWAPGDSKIL